MLYISIQIKLTKMAKNQQNANNVVLNERHEYILDILRKQSLYQ